MIDVIIIGAGPGGLTIAAELASRGISCRIYEKRTTRSIESRAIGLLPYTLELLDMRHLATRFIQAGLIIDQVPLGNGQSLQLNQLKNDTQFPFMLSIPQTKTEELLEQWALGVGVEIVKGVELIQLKQDNEVVCVTLSTSDKTWEECARYVIGSDGKNSSVRSLLGVEVTSIKYNKTLMHGDVKLRHFPKHTVFAKISKQGMIAAFPLPGDYYRLLVLDHQKMNVPAQRQIGLDDFKESAQRLGQCDLGIDEPLWLSSFNTEQKHSSRYRVNRVFLLGDAAHTHIPAGGQGLQSAIEDAFNLGWKLASVIHYGASDHVLDSYEYERRRIAKKAMIKSNWLFRYEISNTWFSYLLRQSLVRIALIPLLQRRILLELSGLANPYKIDSTSKHALIGDSVLNKHVAYVSGERVVIREILRLKKGIFLSNVDEHTLSTHKQDSITEDLERIHGYLYEYPNIKSMIIRPDGIVAWALS